MRARRLAPLLFALAVLVSAAWLLRPYAHGLSFVVRAAGVEGTARRVADLDTTATHEREITIPIDGGPLRALVYESSRSRRRSALLVSGLHPAGIDDPGLVALARHLSASGLTIVTPDISELSHFELGPTIADAIQQAGTWLSSEAALAPDHQVGLIGLGVGGGLSVVAAGRPAMAGRVAFVLSFGGHDDLPRVMKYLCTGVEARPSNQIRLKADSASEDPSAFVRPPDPYGLAGLLLGLAPRIVPPGQVEPLRDAIRRFLSAPPQGLVDAPPAETELESQRAAAKRLPEPSATLLRYVYARDVAHLGARLLPYVDAYGRDPSLSPSRSPKPSVPVFLLHRADDNLVPAVESEYLAEALHGHAPVRLLISSVASTAEGDRRLQTGEVLKLAGFWGDLLSR
jgi:dienelactone hydrolase